MARLNEHVKGCDLPGSHCRMGVSRANGGRSAYQLGEQQQSLVLVPLGDSAELSEPLFPSVVLVMEGTVFRARCTVYPSQGKHVVNVFKRTLAVGVMGNLVVSPC